MNFLTKHGTHNNPVLRIAVAVLFVILPLMGFALGVEYQTALFSYNINLNNPSYGLPKVIVPTPTPGKCIKTDTGKCAVAVAVHDKRFGNTTKSFSVTYPDDWQYQEIPQNGDRSPVVVLSKDEVVIHIDRTTMGVGGVCSYGLDKQSMFKRYDELTKPDSISWRLSYDENLTNDNKHQYIVCEKSEKFAGDVTAANPFHYGTSIGFVAVSYPVNAVPATLNEAKEILKGIYISKHE